MTIGERIKKLRKENGMTQKELAEKININKQNLYKYENDIITNIPSDKIEAIAKVYGVSPSYLMGWDNQREPSNISEVYTDGIYRIPVFETVSAGFGAYASCDIIDYIPVFVKNPAEVPDLMGIRVSGDSMYPKIEDGDIIVVHKQSSVDSGSIAVVLLDNEEGLVKKMEYGSGWIDLISINPEYKTKHFEGAEVLRLQVVGLVRQVIKLL